MAANESEYGADFFRTMDCIIPSRRNIQQKEGFLELEIYDNKPHNMHLDWHFAFRLCTNEGGAGSLNQGRLESDEDSVSSD